MRRSSFAAALWFAAGMLPAFVAPALHAAGAPPTRPSPTRPPPRPVFEPVSLHAWARTIGFSATWIERDKKLRLHSRLNDLVFEADRREISVNGLRVFLGDAPRAQRRTLTISPLDCDRLLLPILAPQRLPAPPAPVRVIALDAGHGGRDKGTSNTPLALLEKDLALDVVRRLQKLLEARGWRVVLTRADDTFIELTERPARAAAAGADLFLSIHCNAGPAAVHGIETYAFVPQHQYSTAAERLTPDDDFAFPGNKWDAWNAHLGYTLHRQLITTLGRFDRGLKRARFVVLRDLAACPGLLIECGYLSNAAEAKQLGDPAFREKLAATIAAGVDAYNTTLERAAPARAPQTSRAAP